MKIKLQNILQWGLGLFFLLLAFSYIDSSILSALFYLLAALIVLPPSSNLLPKLIKRPVSGNLKALAVILLFFFAGVASTTSANKNPQTSQPSPPPVTQSNETDQNESSASILGDEGDSIETKPAFYQVKRVIDGDTIQVDIDGKTETVRLIGIDSPETVDPRQPVQCFGKEASDKAKEVLLGKKVSLESDPSQGDLDVYQRQLRYIFLEDGTSFNKMMIEEGYAHEYTYNAPYKYRDEFIEAEKKAQSLKKGLWAEDACPATSTPTPTKKPASITTRPTSVPTMKSQAPNTPPPTALPTQTQVINPPSNGSWVCDCKRTCTQIASCEEAYFQVNTCGCQARDGDNDGIPCENLCP
ncbi:MAG: thermonuclease family protein [Patescibacteria group bacterium]|jgi:endonuclease YncB( thermonuclease family)